MRRRTLLKVLATSVPVLPSIRVRLGAQVRAFTPEAVAVLRDVAATVLPASLGADKVSQGWKVIKAKKKFRNKKQNIAFRIKQVS